MKRSANARFAIESWDERTYSEGRDLPRLTRASVTARLGGKAGTFVLRHIGVFEDGQAKVSYSVVPGSATRELQGLHGDGSFAVGHGTEHPFLLSYDLG